MQASAFLGTRMTSGLVASRPSSGTPCRQVTTCMAKKKGIRCIVTLECTEARKEGGTPSRYTTQKNRKNTSERLELKKYNKFLRRVTVHKEIK
ncbi:g7964 [Coccomyxa elongata]|nr:probable 50S ribosomal protein L33 [Coccomyxa sp. Obi]